VPLLWRPVTGLMSFNLPAYRFDLRPFLGLLNDGAAHTFAVGVAGSGPTGKARGDHLDKPPPLQATGGLGFVIDLYHT
jgi:hypothetical protein